MTRHTVKGFVAAIALLFTTPFSFAVNGAFDYGFSEITRGMGGAGAAFPQDTLIAAINPAGMVWTNHLADGGIIFYHPTMSYVAADVQPNAGPQIIIGPGKHTSSYNLFGLPDFGLNMPLNDKSSFGVSLYSLGGFGSSYPANSANTTLAVPVPFPPGFVPIAEPGPFGAGKLASDLKQLVGSFTYSRKLAKRTSMGLSLLLGAQTFSGKGAGLLAPFSNDPSNLSNRGHDYSLGAGVRGGLLFGLIPRVRLALSYQPQMVMSRLSKYAGLFPKQGKFNIPSNGVVGIAIDLPKNFELAFDVQEIWFNEIRAYGNGHSTILPGGACSNGAGGPTCFGGDDGVGFSWHNVTAYKVGLQWQFRRDLAFRVGYNHANTVFSPDALAENVIAPGGAIQNIYTAGVSKKVGACSQLNGVVAYVPSQTVNGYNAFSTSANQTVAITAKGFGVGVSYSWLL